MKALIEDPQAWSAIATNYDETARRTLTAHSQRAVQWIGLEATDEVLDVAAGPGTTTMLAAPRVRSVHAVDFAPRMIEVLRRNVAAFENVTAEIGDGQKLRAETGRFSVAFSMFGLMFFPDPHAGLRELHRVLRPEGRVLISSWVPAERSPMMRTLVQALMHAIPPQPDQSPPEPFAFETPESLVAALTGAGFEDAEVEEYAPEIPVGSAEAFWEETRGNLIVQHLRTLSGERWPAIEAKVIAHVRQSIEGVNALQMPALLARATRVA